MPTLDTISYTPAFRHTIDRDTNPNFTKPGRYILGSNGHFRGLVVHSDGTLIITTDHRTANNIVIDRRWLLDMQSEAVFRVAPFSLDADSGGIGSRDLPTHSQGCVERLNEGSGGSHLSAGAAVASASLDLRGGAVLLPELLQLLPSYYFCMDYLSTLAACSRSLKQQVLNKNHWRDYHLDLEVPELLHDHRAIKAMSRWWETARAINLSQHQLTRLNRIPHNCLLRWRSFEWPSSDQQSSGHIGQFIHSLVAHASRSTSRIMSEPSAWARSSLDERTRVVYRTNVFQFQLGAFAETSCFAVCFTTWRSFATSFSELCEGDVGSTLLCSTTERSQSRTNTTQRRHCSRSSVTRAALLLDGECKASTAAGGSRRTAFVESSDVRSGVYVSCMSAIPHCGNSSLCCMPNLLYLGMQRAC